MALTSLLAWPLTFLIKQHLSTSSVHSRNTKMAQIYNVSEPNILYNLWELYRGIGSTNQIQISMTGQMSPFLKKRSIEL